MEKRKVQRNGIGGGEKAYIETVLSYPKGIVLKNEIIDMSDSGLSFKMPKADGYFHPGTPLKDIKIISGGKKESIEYGEVVYVSEVDDDASYYKIGIAFKRLKKDYSSHKRNLRIFEKLETERRNINRYSVVGNVKIESKDGELSAETLNISEKGLRIESSVDLFIGLEVKIQFSKIGVSTKGKVLWSAPADRDGYYHIAILFDNPIKDTNIFCGQILKDARITGSSNDFIDRAVMISNTIKRSLKRGLYFRTVSSAPSNHIIVEGKELINFVSYNYLGLAIHPKIKEAMINSIKKYGSGSAGPPVLCGTTELHNELEDKLAKLKGTEAACLFTSGFATNAYFLITLLDSQSIIICDEKVHASIMDGAVLSGAEIKIFRHNNMSDLGRILDYYPLNMKKLIVIDGIYSMDGDIADLPNIYKLAQKNNAKIMVDEAHAIGVVGAKGHGVVEHFGLEGKIDFTIGTLSKTFGSAGGFVACSNDMKIFLKTGARAIIFSAALPPCTCAGVIAAIDVLEQEPELRTRLWHNINQIKNGLKEMEFNVGNTESSIIPVIIGHEIKTYQIAKILQDEYGIFVAAITRPAVPRGSARLRLCITALHTDSDINYTLDAFKSLKKRFNI